jgi:hypothetical protein
VPGAGFGIDEGLIFGNRFPAFPGGLIEVTEPGTVGRGPIGRCVPRPLAAVPVFCVPPDRENSEPFVPGTVFPDVECGGCALVELPPWDLVPDE